MRVIFEEEKEYIYVDDLDPHAQYILGMYKDGVGEYQVFIVDSEGYVYNVTYGLEPICDEFKPFLKELSNNETAEIYAFNESINYLPCLRNLINKVIKEAHAENI
jgi:hypothetical protein